MTRRATPAGPAVLEAIKLQRGEKLGIYVHSTRPGDESIVYDEMRYAHFFLNFLHHVLRHSFFIPVHECIPFSYPILRLNERKCLCALLGPQFATLHKA
jgi:hypothetical protein